MLNKGSNGDDVGLCLASIINAMNGALFDSASQTIIPLVVGEDSLVQDYLCM